MGIIPAQESPCLEGKTGTLEDLPAFAKIRFRIVALVILTPSCRMEKNFTPYPIAVRGPWLRQLAIPKGILLSLGEIGMTVGKNHSGSVLRDEESIVGVLFLTLLSR